MNRRKLITLGGGGLLVGCGGIRIFPSGKKEDDTVKKKIQPIVMNQGWEDYARELENAAVIRTRDNPGADMTDESIVKEHLPKVEWGHDLIAIYVDHPMEPNHFIMAMYARDQDGMIFGMKKFIPTRDDRAWVAFGVPEGTTAVSAFCYCNTHDHWCEKHERPHL